MNTGQMLLTLGALLFLSTMILRYNRADFASEDAMNNSKFNILASSLCTSIIEEAKGKAFDENTIDTSLVSVTGLSKDLKAEGGETYETFDDFDDFNNYIKIDSSMQNAPLYATCKVYYVKEADPNKESNKPTWYKAITVTVVGDYMNDWVEMSSIYSYWFFR
jgi:hypothetical protein